jgi:hypothetical protein
MSGTATTSSPAKQNGKAGTELSGIKFVNCDLDKDQKEALALFADELENMEWIDWLEGLVTLGHIISVRSNEVGFQCSVTGGSRDGSVHQNMSLIARASSPLKAIQSAMFKDTVILSGTWPIVDKRSELDL